MNSKTIEALISRGIDSLTARDISSKNLTISKLKEKNHNELLALGLSSDQASNLLREQRPPIPNEVLLRLLYKSRRTCCICRDSSKPIIVHHIVEWAKSRNHNEENLVVLCLEHHDLAHTQKELSQGLSIDELKQSKESWLKSVELLDAKTILTLKEAWEYSRWDWINIPRLFELIQAHGTDYSFIDAKLITYLQTNRFISIDKQLLPEESWGKKLSNQFWFLDFGEGMYISWYLSLLVDFILKSTPLIDITPFISSKQKLSSIISIGSFVAMQLPFYFQDIDKFEKGRTQLRRSYYRGHGIKIEYTFNAWYCLSSSARFDAMSGRKVKTIFGFITSIIEEDGELLISISCIAAGTAFATHPARQYSLPNL